MTEIESIDGLEALLESEKIWRQIAVQGLDLKPYAERLRPVRFDDCIFLGCGLPAQLYDRLVRTGNSVFPKFDLPFTVYRNRLYERDELFEGYLNKPDGKYADSLDARIYGHYLSQGGIHPASIRETLARRLHDHAITDALEDLLHNWDDRRIVAVMGGHMLGRNTDDYLQVARIGQKLVANGFLPVSGGGPGAMEAVHLGAAFAHKSEAELLQAIEMLSSAPDYHHSEWLSRAFGVVDVFDLHEAVYTSIGIPTWMYGHEPPNPFPSHIAKYFDNSIREESLLAIAKGGVVYASGSAGTIQEIFQDACQNHYETFGFASPMIFLNERYWTIEKPVYPLVQKLAADRPYGKLLYTADNSEQAMQYIQQFSDAAST